MTISTAQHERNVRSIIETDRARAQADAEERVIGEALEFAPFSYATIADANAERRLGALLAELPEHLVRSQVIRFLAERFTAAGLAWGWGDVDEVERIFRRLAGEARAAQLAETVGAAEAAQLVGAMPADWAELDVLAEELRGMEPAVFAAFCRQFGQSWPWRPYAGTLRKAGWTRAMIDSAWAWMNTTRALDDWSDVNALNQAA